MTRELTEAAEEFFGAIDTMDVERILTLLADDVEGVDEISRRWVRGKSAIGTHIRELAESVGDVKSVIRDAHERTWGDIGLLTCRLEQSYTQDGKAISISAPTTVLFARQGGAWRLSLYHSFPLPDA